MFTIFEGDVNHYKNRRRVRIFQRLASSKLVYKSKLFKLVFLFILKKDFCKLSNLLDYLLFYYSKFVVFVFFNRVFRFFLKVKIVMRISYFFSLVKKKNMGYNVYNNKLNFSYHNNVIGGYLNNDTNRLLTFFSLGNRYFNNRLLRKKKEYDDRKEEFYYYKNRTQNKNKKRFFYFRDFFENIKKNKNIKNTKNTKNTKNAKNTRNNLRSKDIFNNKYLNMNYSNKNDSIDLRIEEKDLFPGKHRITYFGKNFNFNRRNIMTNLNYRFGRFELGYSFFNSYVKNKCFYKHFYYRLTCNCGNNFVKLKYNIFNMYTFRYYNYNDLNIIFKRDDHDDHDDHDHHDFNRGHNLGFLYSHNNKNSKNSINNKDRNKNSKNNNISSNNNSSKKNKNNKNFKNYKNSNNYVNDNNKIWTSNLHGKPNNLNYFFYNVNYLGNIKYLYELFSFLKSVNENFVFANKVFRLFLLNKRLNHFKRFFHENEEYSQELNCESQLYLTMNKYHNIFKFLKFVLMDGDRFIVLNPYIKNVALFGIYVMSFMFFEKNNSNIDMSLPGNNDVLNGFKKSNDIQSCASSLVTGFYSGMYRCSVSRVGAVRFNFKSSESVLKL